MPEAGLKHTQDATRNHADQPVLRLRPAVTGPATPSGRFIAARKSGLRTPETPPQAPAAPAETREATGVRPLPPVLDAAVDDVFLAPRVVDQTAFESLASELRRILHDAASESTALSSTAADTRALCKDMREASELLKTRLDTAVRMVPTLDGRMERVRAALAEVEAKTKIPANVAEQLREAVEDRLGAFESRLTALTERFEARAGEVETRLAEAERRADERTARLEELAERVAAQLASMETRSATALEAATKAEQAAARAVAEAAEEAERRASEILERTRQAVENAAAAEASASQRTGEIEERLVELVGQADNALRDLRGRFTRVEAEVAARLGELAEPAERAADLLHRMRDIDALKDQIDEARRTLAQSVLEAAEQVDQLDARAKKASETARRHLRKLDPNGRTMRELQELVASLESRRDALASDADRVAAAGRDAEAAVRAAMDDLSERVEQAGAWLGALIADAQRLAR